MDHVRDLTRRALAFAEGIDVAGADGPSTLRRRYVARLAGTAGPDTLAAARDRCLAEAADGSTSTPVIAAALLEEAAQAWDTTPRG